MVGQKKITMLLGRLSKLDGSVKFDRDKALPSNPDLAHLVKYSDVKWLGGEGKCKTLKTELSIFTAEIHGDARITRLELRSFSDGQVTVLDIDLSSEPWTCLWNKKRASKLIVELDNFIPVLSIDKKGVGPRSIDRAYHNAYLVVFEKPLEALKQLMAEFHYLGSSRQPPPSLFKPATADPSEVGASGEFAAQLLHRRQNDVVHFLPMFKIVNEEIVPEDVVSALSLGDAVNSVLSSLSVNVPAKIKEIENVGFQLKFGNASIGHVGRGLGQLLPMVELGLFADPLRFKGEEKEVPLADYIQECPSIGHIALEEPEAHLHPKVATLLAHWLVSLAQSNRRVLVETHSDHLVRRLRGLVARAQEGGDLEKWLMDNVVLLSVEQESDGCSRVSSSYLTRDGGLNSVWPSEFMDESSNEESAIYFAQLEKGESAESSTQDAIRFVAGAEPEMDEKP